MLAKLLSMSRSSLILIFILYIASILTPVFTQDSLFLSVPMTFRLSGLIIGAVFGWVIASLGTAKDNHPTLLLLFFSVTTLLLSVLQLGGTGWGGVAKSPDYAAFCLALFSAGLGLATALKVVPVKIPPWLILFILVQLNVYLLGALS
jgi:hypothetical protein